MRETLEAVDVFLDENDLAPDLLERVRLALDPDLVHETSWDNGCTPFLTLTYRPKCTCGWRGDWLASIDAAEAAGVAHAT